MFITIVVRGSVATLKLEGKFIFEQHREFRKVIKEQLEGGSNAIEIDFNKVDHLDSSALGMLLQAKEGASNLGKTISLVNCGGMVKQVLDIANFQRLFAISY